MAPWLHIGKNTQGCVVFTGVPGLMFTKLSAITEQRGSGLFNNEIATAGLRFVCYGNRFVARVT